MEKFLLTINNKLDCNENLSWHYEVKFVIYYDRTTNNCLRKIKILLVNRKYVIICNLYKSTLNDAQKLLTYSNDNRFFKYPDCLNKNKLYYRFENDIYIDVDKEDLWTYNDLKDELYDHHILNMFDRNNNLSNYAFLLGIQSYLTIKPQMIKYVSSEINIKYSNLSETFKALTSLPLNNNEVNIQWGFEKLKKSVNALGNLYFNYLCNEKNKHLNNLINSHTPEEKIRAYLSRKDVTSIGKNEFGDYIVEVCKKIQADVIYSDHQIENICYSYLPIKTKDGEIMFIDNDNYAHHYSESRICSGIITNEILKKNVFNYQKEDKSFYEYFVNWIMKKLHLYDKRIKIGWWNFNLFIFKDIIVLTLIILCIMLSIPIIYICINLSIFKKIKPLFLWIFEKLHWLYNKVIKPYSIMVLSIITCFSFDHNAEKRVSTQMELENKNDKKS